MRVKPALAHRRAPGSEPAAPTAMAAARPLPPATDQATIGALFPLEPIREGSSHEQGLGRVKRLSMMRIMASRMKATTVLA